ncbi:hypothetical protein, partial [Pseudomonas sp. A-R-19]|uniref:hypothetical protein n=1 Tax=Pseudomonas sp. A-R-19 TaxID=2832403 RepID=UPI001CC08110
HHFHADHPVFSCSKIEQKQLNTWVSFQSAEQPLLGQFSVSGNTYAHNFQIRQSIKPHIRPWPPAMGILPSLPSFATAVHRGAV